MVLGYGAIKTAPGESFGGGNNIYSSTLFSLDASLSNSIYGNSDTVTPKSTSCMLILKY